MLIHDRIAELPGGDPVPANTQVYLKRALDDSVVMVRSTDPDGFVTFRGNGSPGPVYMEVSVGNETRIRHGAATNQVGSWYEAEWEVFVRTLSDGVLRFDDDRLEVVPGTGLSVQVRPGSCVASGILAKWHEPETVSLPANGSGHPRHHAVCIAVWTEGPEKGRSEVMLAPGDAEQVSHAHIEAVRPPAATMVVLAQVRVQSGAVVIQESDITDVRLFASPVHGKVVGSEHIMDGAIESAHLATGAVTADKIANNTITAAKLAAGAVTGPKIADGAVTSGKIADGAVGSTKIADGSVTTAKLASLAVTDAKIATGTITGAKLANNTIPEEKLHSTVRTKLNAVGTASGDAAFIDRNFAGNFYVSSWTTLASFNLTLGPGKWLIWSNLNCSAVSHGDNGLGGFRLGGTAAPSGSSLSERNYPLVWGVSRQIVLTGRRIVTHSAQTTYTLNAQARRVSGGQTYIQDGVLYVVAIKVA